jgi:hypothetical protein
MKVITKTRVLILIIILLGIFAGGQFFKAQDLKWQLIYEKSIPDVELINYLSFNSKDVVSGSATGFVLFDDREKQPRDLRQYVRIAASDNFEDGKQVFYLTDIIKMNVLAPRFFDPVVLRLQGISNGVVTLADSDNNLYFIDKTTSEVTAFDGTKDATRLVTSDLEFRDLMRDFLK